MTYLLDTHVFLWWLADDPSLSAKARSLISDEKNFIFVSAASAWEIIIKKKLGKLVAPDDLVGALKGNNFKRTFYNFSACHSSWKLTSHHNDLLIGY